MYSNFSSRTGSSDLKRSLEMISSKTFEAFLSGIRRHQVNPLTTVSPWLYSLTLKSKYLNITHNSRILHLIKELYSPSLSLSLCPFL